jgi:predicted MFS family arabinose efflux permease
VATPAASAAHEGASAERLYTRALLVASICGGLGFAHQFVIQPILPLLILANGGDAALVGLFIAAFSIPSVLMRPLLGNLADRSSIRSMLAAGTGGLGFAGLIYLIPSLAVLFIGRVFHGIAWAAFNTGAPALFAKLAPPTRRAEATSIYHLLPGLAQTVMPAIGLIVYAQVGLVGPFVLCSLLGWLAFATVVIGVPRTSVGAAARTDAPAPARARPSWSPEQSAVLPMSIELLFSFGVSLFLTFPPLWAAQHGIDVASLTLYYPIFGLALVSVRAIGSRVLDRYPRRGAIATGAALAMVGFTVAAFADTIQLLTVAGVIYATAAAFTQPSTMALAVDRSHPARIGSSMATYTLGYQLALGLGAAVWGVVIDQLGFPAPFVLAIVPELLVLLLLVRSGSTRTPVAESVGR